MKHFVLGNTVIYEALGQVILPLGLSGNIRQYHLPLSFLNHDIAQKEVFYSVIISCVLVSMKSRSGIRKNRL